MNNTIRTLIGLATAGTVITGSAGAYIFLNKKETFETGRDSNQTGMNKFYKFETSLHLKNSNNSALGDKGRELSKEIFSNQSLTGEEKAGKMYQWCKNPTGNGKYEEIRKATC